MVSDEWRELTAEEKEKWEVMAREDKARYIKEKDEYAGPWKVPADMKKPKDPTAPKKPTPAYFSFSNERRHTVKKDNPSAGNGEISKILSRMWKEADKETRSKYLEKEKTEREAYNKEVEKWKKERKESGRENWWEFEQPPEEPPKGRKRQKLDALANTASGSQAEGNGASLAPQANTFIPPSFQEQLSALSAQGNNSFFNSLLPGFSGNQNTAGAQASSSLGNNAFGGNMQAQNSGSSYDALQQLLNQQMGMGSSGQGPSQQNLGGGLGGLSSLFGSSSSGVGAFQNSMMQQPNQQNLLALLGGGAVGQQQQQQSQPSNSQGMNDFLLSSLLSSGGMQQQQQQQQQSLPSSFLQQGMSGNSLFQQQNNQGNTGGSALSSFLQQQQAPMGSSSNQPSDQMAMLQSLLQQQGGGITQANLQQQQLQQSRQPSNDNAALEEALARLVRGNQG